MACNKPWKESLIGIDTTIDSGRHGLGVAAGM